MTHTVRGRAPLALVLAALSLASVAAQGLTPIQVMRLQSVTAVLDAGAYGVLYVQRTPRLGKDGIGGTQQALYLLPKDGGAPKLLVRGGGGFAVWGDKVTFAARPSDTPHAEVMAKSLADGAVTRVTTTPAGVSAYRWSPDHEHIAFTQLDPVPEGRATARRAGFDQVVYDEDYRQLSLWLWTRKTGEVRRLTDKGSVFDFAWSHDGSRLALALAPRNLVDDSYMFKRLHVVDLRGVVRPVTDNPGKLGDLAWSPDGTTVAYISAADARDPHAGMVYAVEVASGKVRALTPGLQGTVLHIAWPRGSDKLHALVGKGVRTYLASIDPATASLETGPGGAGVAFSSVAFGEGAVLAVGSTASHPGEAFAIDEKTGAARRLTDSNPWLAEVKLGRQEIERVTARDGLAIEGLLIYPVGYERGKRYPMVIVAHGGPESHFDEGWNTSYAGWGQMLAARGYFAWYPNYRSSTGYGVAFTKHDHGDLMGGEFDDHVDAIKAFAERGLVDPSRVGLGGGSYGGYTAAWAATKGTEHFAAAVSFVPFVDIRTKWYTSDIPWEFYYVHYQERFPHQQVGYLHDRSPLTWAAECRTPLLLLGGTADPRVHPSQPHMMYRAVKFATDTPVRYVQYPGEGHGNRVNVHQYDYAVRTLRWFDHYLKPGDHRKDPPPPLDVDYSDWYATK